MSAEISSPQTISVIIPMYNAAAMIDSCLAPLLDMLRAGQVTEIIVVDDCSTDESPQVVRRTPGIGLMRTAARGGPGAARNVAAAQACGRYLWFVDSDVIVAPDAGGVIHAALAATPAAALMGSYDDEPAARNWLSQYKNLVHHYYHQRGREDASTFWAGCGVMEREIFLRVGGFDVQRYPYPSIEDIELGYRIRDAGARIKLVPGLRGKHLKNWRFLNLIHTEVFRRGLPWTRLMLERGGLTDDLNVSLAERGRAVMAFVTLCSVLAWMTGFVHGIVPAACVVLTLALNADFLRFFTAKRGIWFAARAALFHQLYYLYSSATFAWGMLAHKLAKSDPPATQRRT